MPPNLNPEQKARVEIDAKLVASGWLVQNREDMDLTAGRGIAVREFPMKSGFGFADYANGVKANVLFFDKKEGRPEPWTEKLWVYDLRTNKHFTQKQSPITRKDFDEFVECYQPGKIHKRKATWSETNPDGRWRCYDYAELVKRDKLSLDLFWVKDQSLTDTDSLPAPDILATEIADELETAFDSFTKIAKKLPKSS